LLPLDFKWFLHSNADILSLYKPGILVCLGVAFRSANCPDDDVSSQPSQYRYRSVLISIMTLTLLRS
jgi:hypothetical protein